MKVLVVYYSKTGNTKMISNEISERLNADVEEIVDIKDRKGYLNLLKSIKETISEKESGIHDLKYNPENYDLVIIGTPVWASRIAPPIITFLKDNRTRFNNVAFFYTQTGSSKNLAFEQMQKFSEAFPVATLSIFGKDIEKGFHIPKIEKFISSLDIKTKIS